MGCERGDGVGARGSLSRDRRMVEVEDVCVRCQGFYEVALGQEVSVQGVGNRVGPDPADTQCA
eukprot:3494101-Rhodomonas_salina.1